MKSEWKVKTTERLLGYFDTENKDFDISLATNWDSRAYLHLYRFRFEKESMKRFQRIIELNWSWFFRHFSSRFFFVFDTQTLIAGFCVVTSSTERFRWKNSFRFSFAPRSKGFENWPIEFLRYSYLLKFTCSFVVRFFTALYEVPIYEMNFNPCGKMTKLLVTTLSLEIASAKRS